MNLGTARLLTALMLGTAILWAYFTTLSDMAARWSDDSQYSHGYLVPLFSLYLLWNRRDQLNSKQMSASWWGVVLLLIGLGIRAAGTLYYLNFLDSISLLFCLAGLAGVVGGRAALAWSWPAILFLGFMAPLPYRLQTALGSSLQGVATKASTFILQTIGAPAVYEGNVILINDTRINIVEACNGLGMLVTFFALSTATAMLMRTSPLWMRFAVIIGAIPVALLANIIRITVTGLLFDASQNETARVVFHDIAGWLMMPLAVLIIFAELYFLNRLLVDVDRPRRTSLRRSR